MRDCVKKMVMEGKLKTCSGWLDGRCSRSGCKFEHSAPCQVVAAWVSGGHAAASRLIHEERIGKRGGRPSQEIGGDGSMKRGQKGGNRVRVWKGGGKGSGKGGTSKGGRNSGGN